LNHYLLQISIREIAVAQRTHSTHRFGIFRGI